MRCHCPHCEEETLMVHSERDLACVCPQCLYRCYACQGTGTALTKEEVSALKNSDSLLRLSHAFDPESDTLPPSNRKSSGEWAENEGHQT